MEFVWETVKYLICEQIDLLICRHLDHLIICSIYAVSRKSSNDNQKYAHKNFTDILQAYFYFKFRYNHLDFTKKDISDANIYNNGKNTLGLKDFYNLVFLQKARHFIVQFNIEETNHPTPIKMHKPKILQRMQMDSPLKQNIQSMSNKSDMAVKPNNIGRNENTE